MTQIHPVPGGVCAAKGFTAAGVHSGIRYNKSKADLALIVSEALCNAAAVYTQNKVKGAPLVLTRQNLRNGTARAILCNSGNANTCNPGGYELAQACCGLAARALGMEETDLVIASTGVIGQPLPLAPFETGIPAAVKALSPAGSTDACKAIMTTDTTVKEFAVEFECGGKTCRLGAIGKGSGMINPNMATMLSFITTDAAVSPALLQQILAAETAVSFNQLCIDGDTSTNDMVVLLANGLAGNAELAPTGPDYETFCAALHQVCVAMVQALAADGEGATKALCCQVTGATSDATARAIAKSVVSSDLFKAAMFGADANWGRALCAIGYTPGDFPVDNVSLTLQSAAGAVLVCRRSMHEAYSEKEATRILSEGKIDILIDMGSGSGQGNAWGCDLTYDYVKINGDYRT